MKLLEQKFDSEMNHLTEKAPSTNLEFILELIEVDLYKNGKINWWWVVFNVGKLVARLVFAIRELKAQKKSQS